MAKKAKKIKTSKELKLCAKIPYFFRKVTLTLYFLFGRLVFSLSQVQKNRPMLC